jgi:hypothetical protein
MVTSPVLIAGKGTRKSDGAPLYGVTSASEPGKLHIVVWEAAQSVWVCDCPRYQWRRTCRHVDAVKARISIEREMKRGREARETSMRRTAAFSILKK